MADSFSRLQLCHRSSFIGKAQSLTMAVSSMTPNTLFTDTQGCRPATETILDVNSNGFSSSNTKTPMDIVLKIKMFINLDTYSNIFKINSCTWWINFGNGMVRVSSRPFLMRIFYRRVRSVPEHRVESEDMERPMEYSRTTSTHQSQRTSAYLEDDQDTNS